MKNKEIKNFKVLQIANKIVTGDFQNVHIPYILNGELYKIQHQNGENVTVTCSHCPPDRVYRGSIRSTGNFHMHIKRRHPNLVARLQEMKLDALSKRRESHMKIKKSTSCNRIKKEFQNQGGNQNIPSKKSSKVNVSTVSVCKQNFPKAVKSQVQVNNRPFLGNINAEPINYSLKAELPCVERELPQTISESYQTQLPIVAETICSLTTNGSIEQIYINNNNSNINFNKIKNELVALDHPIDLSLERSPIDAKVTGNFTRNLEINSSMHPLQGNLLWEDVLLQVEQSLRGIQREMGTRNQIETNRIFLDLAKFKYLNPGFNL